MQVLVVHNFYQQPGGEDQVFRDEVELLRANGDEVESLEFDNDAIAHMGKLALAGKTIWNRQSYQRIRQACDRLRPQVVHFHNTFPLVSPAGYAAARDSGAAVVQTLHNYRLICPAATLFRDGHVCEQCIGRAVPWPAVAHRCYRQSRSASAVAAALLSVHRFRGTFANAVDRYIALTDFARGKLIEGGLPAARLVVKPNFVQDPGLGDGSGDYCLFVGRLAPEKGIATLLEAWTAPLPPALPRMRLQIVGDGPLAPAVRDAAAKSPAIQFRGRLNAPEVFDMMGRARLLIFPSEWYEGLPRTIIESYAKGTPVLASRLGSMPELVVEGRTGACFKPGSSADLIEKAQRLLADEQATASLRRGAREAFESRYTAAANYRSLRKVYQDAVAASPATRGATPEVNRDPSAA